MIENTICLNEKYSTTKLLMKDKTQIINDTENKLESVLFLTEGKNQKGKGGLRTKGYSKKSYDDKPLLSIITVVYNGEKYLEETIQSVINQSYNNVEYIIIDGGSIDRTLDIIKKYENKIDYWVTEKDNGIYDAMNKGIDLVNGEWINFMNAGDIFYSDDVLTNIFKTNNDCELLVGSYFLEKDSKVIKSLKIIQEYRIGSLLGCHQAMFFNKERLGNILEYDLSYKICSDFDLMNKILKNFKIKFIEDTICNFQDGGLSASKRLQIKMSKERYKSIYKNFGLLVIIKTFFINKIKRYIPNIFFKGLDSLFLKVFSLLPKSRFYKFKAFLLNCTTVFSVDKTSRIFSTIDWFGPKVYVGSDTFVGHQVLFTGGVDSKIIIGDNIDIAPKVIFGTGTHTISPDEKHIAGKGITKDIFVGDGSWIGMGVIILPGVKIGEKSIVAAGAVVKDDIPAYTLCAGVPAKVVKRYK